MVRPDNNTPSRAPSRKPNPTPTRDPTPLIASASKTELAALLQQLCAESRRARRAVEKALRPRAGTTSAGRKAGGRKRRRAEEGEEGGLGREDAAAGVEEEEDYSAPASKRTAVCRNCGAGYVSSGGNGGDGGVCVYHPGTRGVNPVHPVWEDFDPKVSGDAWTLMEYEEFAEGFQWSCCNGELGGEGCTVGRGHEAAPVGGWRRGRKKRG